MPEERSLSLKTRQRAVFTSTFTPAKKWNTLCSDDYTRALLSTLFTPSALRRNGITLHTHVDSAQTPIPDVSPVYIVCPTAENIAHLLRNLPKSPTTLAFTSFISSALLRALVSQLPLPSPFSRVLDLYAEYVTLEHNLFSLNITQSYKAVKQKDDNAAKSFIEVATRRLLSVLITLGVVPIIRAQRGGAAEALAYSLYQALREALPLFENAPLSAKALSFRRPLLLLLDRDIDHTPILHHCWTYQPLVHDCLDTSLNKVHVKVGEERQEEKTYTLDKDIDSFWAKNASKPFPSVAEAIETALKRYRADVEHINRNTGANNANTNTAHLAATISSLPELSKQKELIDVHTNIATALLHNVNKRSLDSFFELESQIMAEAKTQVTALAAEEYKAAVIQLLKGEKEATVEEQRGSGNATDRLRLFLIYYTVFGSMLSEKTMAQFRGILHSAGIDSTIVEFLGKMRGFRHDLVTESPPLLQGTLSTERLKGIMTNVVNRGYRSFANVAQNAKKLIVEQRKSYSSTRVLEVFMSEQARSRQGSWAEEILDGYLLYDAKVMDESGGSGLPVAIGSQGNGDEDSRRLSSREKMQRMVFSDVIVFTVGGGNYVEYENCVEFARSISSAVSGKNVLYGSTELLTGEGFVQQVLDVSKESG